MNRQFKKVLTLFMALGIIFGSMTTVFGAGMADYDYVDEYKDGFAAVQKQDKWGFVNEAGEEVVPPIYDGICDFENGFAAVEKQGKWGFINEAAEEITPLIYKDVYNFWNGFAGVVRDGKIGFINEAGKEVVPPTYDGIYDFKNGFGKVEKDGKVGFINESRKEIVPCIYDEVYDFENGFAGVEKGGKLGFVNEAGKEVIPCIYDETYNFEYGFAVVVKQGKWGLIDQVGKEVIPCIYDAVEYADVENGKYRVFKDGTSTVIDLNNNKRPEQEQPKKSIMATSTNASVLVNNVPTKFEAYTISGNNYFKLRDLAKVLSGSKKQFEVKWDNTVKAINLLSGKPYTTVGGEMIKGDGKSKSSISNTSKIYVDGKEVKLTAYTIGGNNYFKLRDIAQVFDIGVTWDQETKTIGIDTSKAYLPLIDELQKAKDNDKADLLMDFASDIART